MTNNVTKETGIDEGIHLSLLNRIGSVQHYFHFLLGFLVPLTLTRETFNKSRNATKIYVRSCAIMDDHIKAISIDEVIILTKSMHEKIKLEESINQTSVAGLQFVESWGYDEPTNYSHTDFCKADSLLAAMFCNDIARVDRELKKHISDASPNVVLINREAAHSFYYSNESEKKLKGAGTARRSIPNFDDLHETIASKYPNTLSVTLEGMSLAYQMALFKHADIIIAQHGAALANLIWCGPNTTLIEIHPNDLTAKAVEHNYFKNLASCMKVHYQRVVQEHCHSEVDISQVLEKLIYTHRKL